MAERPALDEGRRRDVVAILSVGCSRRIAAGYVGCAVSAIRRTAKRDPRFAEQLRHAEHKVEISYLQQVKTAAAKEQFWPAATWALERKNPQDHAPRGPGAMTEAQVQEMVGEMAEMLVELVPSAKTRQRILKRLEACCRRTRDAAHDEGARHEP